MGLSVDTDQDLHLTFTIFKQHIGKNIHRPAVLWMEKSYW